MSNSELLKAITDLNTDKLTVLVNESGFDVNQDINPINLFVTKIIFLDNYAQIDTYLSILRLMMTKNPSDDILAPTKQLVSIKEKISSDETTLNILKEIQKILNKGDEDPQRGGRRKRKQRKTKKIHQRKSMKNRKSK